MQLLIIMALCAAAAFYLGRRVWLTFATKEAGCAKGCGGACGAALDVDALQRTIEARTAGR
ncbi:FeoB-associated Cys-rich membrane protein [Hymenobacter bucti]